MTNDSKLIFEAYAGEPQPISKEGGPSATPLQTPPNTPESEPDTTEARMAKEVINLADSIKEHAERIAGLWSNQTPIMRSQSAKNEFTRILNMLEHFIPRE